MSETTVQVSMPLDEDGFLRRECPTCERQFKWRSGSEETVEAAEAPEMYYCPYCAEPADTGSWWTPQQLEYAQQYAAAEVLGPGLAEFQRSIARMNQPGGIIQISMDVTLPSQPEPLVEPNDMARVDFPCHPEGPLKVADDWDAEVSCLVCGIRYPAELVRALPEEGV
jgi:hypothetical protein